MNTHLRERVETLIQQYTEVTLGTCGQAGPQISFVSCELRDHDLFLYVPRNSDHLFNLEGQPEIVLLTPMWKLDGQAVLADDVAAPYGWQTAVHVHPRRFTILAADGQSTIDF